MAALTRVSADKVDARGWCSHGDRACLSIRSCCSWLACKPCIPGHLFTVIGRGRAWPPPVDLHQAGVHEMQPVEESCDLGATAQRRRAGRAGADAPCRLPDLICQYVAGWVEDCKPAAWRDCLHQPGDDQPVRWSAARGRGPAPWDRCPRRRCGPPGRRTAPPHGCCSPSGCRYRCRETGGCPPGPPGIPPRAPGRPAEHGRHDGAQGRRQAPALPPLGRPRSCLSRPASSHRSALDEPCWYRSLPEPGIAARFRPLAAGQSRQGSLQISFYRKSLDAAA